MTNKRNTTIIQLYQSGTQQVDLARQFGISRSRVHQIIEQAERSDARRAKLEAKYGSHPRVAALPDETPIELLHLCQGRIQGWGARLERFETQGIDPLRTLGDPRRTSDEQLLREPMLGKKMLSELRRFCPRRNPGYGGKRYYKRGSLSAKLTRRGA